MTKRNITYQLNIAISNAIASRKTRVEYEKIAYEMHQAMQAEREWRMRRQKRKICAPWGLRPS